MYTFSFHCREGSTDYLAASWSGRDRDGLCWGQRVEGQTQAHLSHQDCIELTHDLIGAVELNIFKNGVSPGHGISRPKTTLQEIEKEILELLFL